MLVVNAVTVHATTFFWAIDIKTDLRAKREAVEALSSVHEAADGLLEQIAPFNKAVDT